MPLTALQTDTSAILASLRSEEIHFAGGLVLNAGKDSPCFSSDFDLFHELAEEVTRAIDPVALKTAWIQMSDEAEVQMTRVADERPGLSIGVAFVDESGCPAWIGDNPSLRLHAPTSRGCWPKIHGLEA